MKEIALSVVIAGILIAGAVIFSGNDKKSGNNVPVDNVTVVEGKQLIDLTAKGGYFPNKSVARSGVPTILRFNTSSTFDCSAAVRIPSLDITKNLPPTGVTEVDLGIPEAGVLKGSCGMGMYPFEIEFQK